MKNWGLLGRSWKNTVGLPSSRFTTAVLPYLTDKALGHALTIGKAKTPTKREFQVLDVWLRRENCPDMGNNFLNKPGDTIWSTQNASDFITLNSREEEEDIITSFIKGTMLEIWHKLVGRRRQARLTGDPVIDALSSTYQMGENNETFELGFDLRRYDDEPVSKAAKVISAMLSSLLPTITI